MVVFYGVMYNHLLYLQVSCMLINKLHQPKGRGMLSGAENFDEYIFSDTPT
jgi:hypothetical protein